jgi:hypothetical protein
MKEYTHLEERPENPFIASRQYFVKHSKISSLYGVTDLNVTLTMTITFNILIKVMFSTN